MTDPLLLGRITARADVFRGKPLIRNMRISVESILALLSQGQSWNEIIDDFPDVEPDDIRAAIAYAHAILANESLDTVQVAVP